MAPPRGEARPAAEGRTPIDVARLGQATGILRTALRLLQGTGVGVLTLGLIFHDPNALVAGTALTLVTPLLFLAMRRDKPQLAIGGGVSLSLLIGCFVLINGGGIHDVGIIAFPGVMVFGSMLLEGRRFLLFAGLAVLAVAAIGTAELTGVLETTFSESVSVVDLLLLLLVLAAMAWLMHAITQTLYRSLSEAHVNEQTYREVFNATSEGILVLEAARGEIVDANEQALSMIGRERLETLGTPLGALLDVEARERLPALLGRTQQDGSQIFECGPVTPAAPAWLEISLRAAEIRGEQRIVAALRDISERKAVEQRALTSERLQAVGQLAGGVAHDFNNQLTAILSNATLLKARLPDDARARAQLDAIIQCSNRSADLTRQLLAFARKGHRRREGVDLDALVVEVSSLLSRSIDKRIALVHEHEPEKRAWVEGDASLLQNALLNLALNARDAMPDGGELRFETTRCDAAELAPEQREQLGAFAGPVVVLRVSDDGVGMGADVLSRAFEPFFTTKPGGNGMGLSAVWGTVRAHGGAIAASSEPGRGSHFELVFPAAEEAPRRAPHGEPVSASLPPLRVLLAEDEAPVARATIEVLKSLGCQVTHCADGADALDTFRRAPDGFDVAMLDHTMPGMTGSHLLSALRELRPGLAVVATSGFHEGWQPDLLGPGSTLLPKPYNLEDLHAALQRAASARNG